MQLTFIASFRMKDQLTINYQSPGNALEWTYLQNC